MPVETALLLSGSVEFLERTLVELVHVQQVIVSVDMLRQGITPKSHREERAKAQTMLCSHGLRPVFFLDADNGGVTMRVTGGTEGRFLNSQTVLKSTIPELLDPPRKVLWHDNVVLAAGLFPCLMLCAWVYSPLHFFPTKWIACPLSTVELCYHST
jgi:hypothetical protein